MSTLIQKLRDGEIVFGGTVSEHLRPSVVKAFASAGFDFVFIENEHGAFEPARLSDFVLCARDNDLTVVAKIPELERAETARFLEMGVMGIQLPRTECAQQMTQLHDFIKFPPTGSRASATGYGNSFYVKPSDKETWYKQANDETFVISHIETRTGVESVEDILAVNTVDICFVGTSDLSLSYGRPGNYTDPQFLSIVQRVFDACGERSVVRGLPATDYDSAKYWIERGVQFFECNSDLDMIRTGATQALQQLHRARDSVSG